MARRIVLALSAPALKLVDALREKLRDAEATLSAIRTGEVDALVVDGPSGTKQIYTLKGADQPYRVLVESMNEGALTLSDRGAILYCNARMAALVGRPLERMMGRPFSDFLVNGDRAVFAKLLRDAPEPRKATVKLRLSKGSTPAQLSLTQLDLDGARAYSAIVTDLTEAFAVRQALLQKDAGLRLVAESAPAILFTADSRGRVLSAAGAALNAINGRVSALLAAPIAGARRRRSPISMRLQAVRTGNVSYDVSYAGRLWNVNLERLGIGGVIGIAVDVTDERRARETTTSAHRERLQRDFVANVSHEFRTPLAAIQGYAETLLDGGLADKKHARGFVRTIDRQAARLSGLVENLLYQSTIESGMLKTTPSVIDIPRFIRDLLKDLRPLAFRRRTAIEVSAPKDSHVYADAGQLRRVFMCVAVNAIVYNRAGGKVSITAETAGGKAKFVISDTGIGITAHELPFIFDRFHRAKNARRLAIKGTGLGLSIAKALIQSNKGRIWAESRLGKGATFHIQLPAAA